MPSITVCCILAPRTARLESPIESIQGERDASRGMPPPRSLARVRRRYPRIFRQNHQIWHCTSESQSRRLLPWNMNRLSLTRGKWSLAGADAASA